jgi:16S rRNA (cytosine1402-N4)-methyltransferase
MRMNQHSKLTAETVINEYEPARLTCMFREYGELHDAGRLVSSISRSRASRRILSTTQLIDCIASLAPRKAENQFYSKVFQAIRIEVNHELDSLADMLQAALELLKSGGRLVIISYHSLEDRMVKNFMRWGNPSEQPGKDIYGNQYEPYRLISRKPLVAGEDEVKINPRARSARLRIAEKK